MTDDHTARRLLDECWGLPDAALHRLGHGLINSTWRVELSDGRCFAMQRVNPVFPPAVNADIDRVTRRLADAGLRTPMLEPTVDGALWLERDGDTWRLMSWVQGVSRDALADADQADRAGELLGRFHRALDGIDTDFANPRLGVHDTARHLTTLRRALDEHRGHREYARVAPLAQDILDMAGKLPVMVATPDRVVHGDPKINNMLFDPSSGAGLALVDLDTVGCMPLPLELGDALRSWCNPAGENRRSGVFSPELFAGALRGYLGATSGWIMPAEQAAILPATLTIIVELAARFCADALNESYFGWDSEQYASRSEHNQLRAAGQLALAQSCQAQYAELEKLAATLFG
jgi:Ser/Thr protein kinase RdoA (MazF antagonist)